MTLKKKKKLHVWFGPCMNYNWAYY